MKYGKHLSPSQVAEIKLLREQNLSYRNISQKLDVSYTRVANLLGGKTFGGRKERRGRKEVLSNREKRLIKRLATKNLMSSRQIKANLGIKASQRTILRHLKHGASLKWGKFQSAPSLTNAHKESRIKWARKYVDLGVAWNMVIFSDEKKFNLDGPDGIRKFWYDPGSTKKVFRKRHTCSGNVMVWAAFSSFGKSSIAVLDGKQNSANYIDTLESNLLPLIRNSSREMITFQQDNCCIHTSKVAKQWFDAQNLRIQ